MAMQRQLRILDTNTEKSSMTHAQTALKVAFATSDLKQVNQHFGSAERFAIYQVDADSATMLEVAEFGELDQDGNENKLVDKFAVLKECAAVYSLAVGPSAVRQLMALGIQPIKLPQAQPLTMLIKELQGNLNEEPCGWIARALRTRDDKDEKRFEEMEDEGWEE